jgi:mannose-6-phosphate isomerase class I
MYDWLRVDLDGSPRPLNIARGMQNLSFERKGEMVTRELISKPRLVAESDAYVLYHLPTHAEHLYDVHRYSIKSEVVVVTNGKVNVLNVVDGSGVMVEVNGAEYSYHYAETFIIPASVPAYTLRVTGATAIMVLVAFIK